MAINIFIVDVIHLLYGKWGVDGSDKAMDEDKIFIGIVKGEKNINCL